MHRQQLIFQIKLHYHLTFLSILLCLLGWTIQLWIHHLKGGTRRWLCRSMIVLVLVRVGSTVFFRIGLNVRMKQKGRVQNMLVFQQLLWWRIPYPPWVLCHTILLHPFLPLWLRNRKFNLFLFFVDHWKFFHLSEIQSIPHSIIHLIIDPSLSYILQIIILYCIAALMGCLFRLQNSVAEVGFHHQHESWNLAVH